MSSSLLVKGMAPTDAERAEHLPQDEKMLRALRLGYDTDRNERIVAFYRRAELARAAMLDDDQFSYGWYDSNGVLQRRTTYHPERLNSMIEGRRGAIFLVAYDPNSLTHILLEKCGGPRWPDPSLSRAADLNSVEGLINAAHERFEDLEALRVIADRLCELGEPRGEFMSLQLAGKDGRHLISPKWIPHGIDHESARFERGCLVQGTCTGPVDATHLGWSTIRSIRFQGSIGYDAPSPFSANPTRLREISNLLTNVVASNYPRMPKTLEVIHVNEVDLHWVTLLMKALNHFPELHTLGFTSTVPGTDPTEVINHVLAHRPARLSSLWLPSHLYKPLEVQRAIANGPDLTVKLFFGSLERGGDATWVAVTKAALTLHKRGDPHYRDFEFARQNMIASGIADPHVHVEDAPR